MPESLPKPTDLFERGVLPVGDRDDAHASIRALLPYLDEDSAVTALHVVDPSWSHPTPEEGRIEYGEEILEIVEDACEERAVPVETEVISSHEMIDTILEVATRVDASVVAFLPREESEWKSFLTGGTARKLVRQSDYPVLVLAPHDDGS